MRRIARFEALEEKQERMVPAPSELIADSADLFHVAVRVEIESCPTSRVAARIIRFVESGDVTRLGAIPITP